MPYEPTEADVNANPGFYGWYVGYKAGGGTGSGSSGGTTVAPDGSFSHPGQGGGEEVEVGKDKGTIISDRVGGNDYANIELRREIPGFVQRWREKVANYSPWNDVFSVTEQESQLVIDVPFENRYLILPYLIGMAWVEGDRLKRINPVRHPYWNWMYCSRAAHAGVRFEGRKITLHSDYGSVAKYKLARFTLGFSNFPWTFLEDGYIETAADEYRRNCFLEMQPTSQFLAAEGGGSVLKFPYTSAGGPATGQAFRAPVGTVCSQIRYVLHWKWVPWDYVLQGLVPTNLYDIMNKCNSTELFGQFPPGTIKAEEPRITSYVSPIRWLGCPNYLLDIDIPLTYFDPPRGILVGDGSEIRGHNLMPFRGNNKWYPATRDGGVPTGSNELFGYAGIEQAFVKPT